MSYVPNLLPGISKFNFVVSDVMLFEQCIVI
jgi:hypothetical protein